jgi:hypothetical protein
MALWAIKSFYRAAKVDWPIYIHAGGPLSPPNQALLAKHLSGCVIISEQEANANVESRLQGLGLTGLLEARTGNRMLWKLVDFLVFAPGSNILSLDSDILFFRQPAELLDYCENQLPHAVFNRDFQSAYSISEAEANQRLGIVPAQQVNAGLAVLPVSTFPLHEIEDFLVRGQVPSDGFTEQTIHALFAAKRGVTFLSERYSIAREPGLLTPAGDPVVARHYAGFTRHLFFEEGIPALDYGKLLH